MTTAELEQVKEKVQKKLKAVRGDVEYLTELTQPIAPENAIGRVSRMDAINNKSLHEATLRQSKRTLGQLESALQRIDQEDPTFGQCTICFEPIPFQRLLLMPEIDKCVKCANRVV